MNFRCKAKLACQHLSLAFYPTTTLYACIVGMVLVNLVLIAFMCYVDKGSFLYNILFALFTGATSSFFVTVIVEMTNNYKKNMLAWHELQEYYNTVINYEAWKHILIDNDFEEEDEETFKKRMEEFDRQLEKNMMPFVSWHISTCCLEIARCIEELEVNIKKKPYVGMHLEWHKNIPNAKREGPIADILYKNAREKFEKRK